MTIVYIYTMLHIPIANSHRLVDVQNRERTDPRAVSLPQSDLLLCQQLQRSVLIEQAQHGRDSWTSVEPDEQWRLRILLGREEPEEQMSTFDLVYSDVAGVAGWEEPLGVMDVAVGVCQGEEWRVVVEVLAEVHRLGGITVFRRENSGQFFNDISHI